MLFSGQGKVYIATRDVNGNPGAFRWIGNTPEMKFSLKTDTLEHKESWSGQRLTDKRLIKGKSAEFSTIMDDFNKENLSMVLYGANAVIAAGTVTDEVLPGGLAVGDIVALAKGKISSLVVKDSAGTPATLVLGTDYMINSADHGSIKVLNLGAYTQPLKASYSNAAAVNINMFTQGAPEVWVRFEGLNTSESNAPVTIDLYKVSSDPLKELSMISDDFVKFDLSGAVLMDDTKINDATLGQFGRVRM